MANVIINQRCAPPQRCEVLTPEEIYALRDLCARGVNQAHSAPPTRLSVASLLRPSNCHADP